MSEVTKPIMLDETGRGIRDALKEIAGAVSGRGGVVYGFKVDPDEADPEDRVAYLKDAIGATPARMDHANGRFDYGSWEGAFFMPRPCMVGYDGAVRYYLDPDDYTRKEDGTASDVANASFDGNAMMEWGQNGKRIWMKVVPDASGYGASIYIADHQADGGFHDWPFHNSRGVPVDHFYTPIYNGSVTGGKMRSLSGQQVGNKLNASAEVAAAKANNPGADALWNIELKADIDLVNALLTLMCKSTDHQAAFGQGLNSGGTEAINDGFRTGIHDKKGLFFGTASGAAATYANAVKVFGMENWYGFQWRRYLGHVCDNGTQKVKLTYGTEDGTSVSDFNLTGDGYITVGATPEGTSGGYIDKMAFTKDGMFPKSAQGTATTHYCDGLWFNNGIVAVPLRGGNSSGGAPVGSFCVDLGNAASNSTWSFGAALSCKPLA